ncbi:replication protein A 70 kDa DNA-binding subunit-like [Centruroides sculpturatus]|uniref:replication protein A 70 kDa DNA-binding subunit-like n=2 Tax=Centruroides sculpturatus TaxID=218467 RepID=UPI000C6D8C55|nr:replication protein A 70 kDa DNA-binding subunit-like [Centruroides sculpturatus]
MAVKLSEGSVKGYKKIPGNANNERYRLLVHDGCISHPFAMLATQLNDKIVKGELERYTVIRLDKYLCNQVQPDKKVLILLEITVLVPGVDVGEKIGASIQSIATSNELQNVAQGNSSNFRAQNTNIGMVTKIRTEPGSTNWSGGYGQRNQQYGGATSVIVHPISSLTPYQNRWTIRARVTNKTNIRTWSNSRGEGKLFSVDLLDESGEIRATAFNEQCDKFFDAMDVNKVYYISKASLKTANKNFTSIKNDYEMSFTSETTVVLCTDNSNSIPMVQFQFVPIDQLQNVEKDKFVDVIGVCKNASDVQTITSRNTNKEFKKRDVHLVDKSGVEVSLTLWGADAEKFDSSDNPIIAVKGVRVSDFGGKSLSMISASLLQINPDIREAHILRGWYDREGAHITTQSLSNQTSGSLGGTWKTFAQAKAEMLGSSDKPEYYITKATIVMVKRDKCMYMACPGDQCNKQVIDMNNGLYRCEKCSREYTSFKWRLLLSVSLADFSENQWVTCFQDVAEKMLGITSEELGTLKETDEEKFKEVLIDANFKSFIFRLRTKLETFNEETRLKTTVMQATPVNCQEYASKLLSDIKQMELVL